MFLLVSKEQVQNKSIDLKIKEIERGIKRKTRGRMQIENIENEKCFSKYGATILFCFLFHFVA